MKRLIQQIILSAFLSLLLSTISIAIESGIKNNYLPGETLIASISGNFISPLTQDSISFYSGRIQIPLPSDIAKIDDKYYLYALLQNQVRNYTLKIKNAHFIENGIENTQDLEYNFSVSGNITDFSVNPGFIITKDDFSIKIQSKSKTVSVTARVLNITQSITVPAGQTRDIFFSIKGFPPFSKLEISSPDTKYLVPVKIITIQNATNQSDNKTSIDFTQSIINITALEYSETSLVVILKNTGTTPLSNLTINSSEKIRIEPQFIEILKPSDSKEINITISLGEKGFYAKITASAQGIFAQIPVYITATKNRSAIVIPTPPPKESCELLGGKICSPEQNCTGDIVSSSEGSCCKGSCEILKSTSNTARYIAIAIITLIIAVIIYFVYKKSKLKKKNFKEVLSDKNKTYEEKIHPTNLPETEVKGKLTKT